MIGSLPRAVLPALFAGNLLVLIDGRAVYSPLVSGVYWDVQDLMLEDLDRIEVIRGPGAKLWGANAVNGVINIITKGSRGTTGGLRIGGGGTKRYQELTRYGGVLIKATEQRREMSKLQSAGAKPV